MTSRFVVPSFALSLCIASLALPACTVEEGPEPAYPPPPPAAAQPVYVAPAPAPVQTEIIADAPPPTPPPPAPEVIPVSPGPDYVWIGGYHRWNGRGYDWEHGRYERRPHPNARFHAAHWERHGNRQAWVAGRWE